MLFTQASALLALTASVSGHIYMGSPVPFDWEDTATKQSPLEPAQFPCKQPTGKYAYTTMNKYKAGESMSVKLIGGATHSGGSCQFSITTDKKPTKDSQWKVLFSQIGGCPGGPSDNNMSGNAEDQGNAPFSVPIPKDIPSGQYTMAWTWNNKSGNREFYMNCAPIEISGGSSTDVSKALGSLPDMFVINLPSTECKLEPLQDALYPNPGKAVATAPAAQPGLKVSGSGCGAQTKLGAGAGKIGAPSQATGAPADGASSAVPSKPTSSAPGVFAPGADASKPTASQPAATQPATSQPTGSPSTPSTPSTGGSGSSCTTDGAVVCIGSSQFGICSNGVATPMALAAGTTCSGGKISRRTEFSA
ncbi:hypothetical protein CC80DRAFT_128579 [Byssothecium circinans]|uniref:AA9 family lytic polysaccharide monooxygenase n=1 Tax=Byssothecium circinans TaxID=147558 RepID=A0A6A5TQA0_9PLEO|nr:hypothetical protein CC80DRAFT_128579 [Byssothecium circinans]